MIYIYGILHPIHFGQRIDFINAFYYRNNQLNYDETFYANLTYNLTNDLEVGLFSMVDNSISTVTPFPFENETAPHFRNSQVVVAPTITHRLYRNFFGHIKLGELVPVRQLRPLDQDFHSIDILKFGPISSLFFKIGFSYRR